MKSGNIHKETLSWFIAGKSQGIWVAFIQNMKCTEVQEIKSSEKKKPTPPSVEIPELVSEKYQFLVQTTF